MEDTQDLPEHRERPWRREFVRLATPARFFSWDGLLRVEMDCPRCLLPTVRDFEPTLPGTKGAAEAVVPEVLGELVSCECDYPHPGRDPASRVTGCGAEWRIQA